MILGSVQNLLRGEGGPEILAGNHLFSDPAPGGAGIFLACGQGESEILSPPRRGEWGLSPLCGQTIMQRGGGTFNFRGHGGGTYFFIGKP